MTVSTYNWYNSGHNSGVLSGRFADGPMMFFLLWPVYTSPVNGKPWWMIGDGNRIGNLWVNASGNSTYISILVYIYNYIIIYIYIYNYVIDNCHLWLIYHRIYIYWRFHFWLISWWFSIYDPGGPGSSRAGSGFHGLLGVASALCHHASGDAVSPPIGDTHR